MSIYRTRPIGEIFEYGKVKLQVVENKTCEGCYLDGKDCWKSYQDNAGTCYGKHREDNKNVIFKRIDK